MHSRYNLDALKARAQPEKYLNRARGGAVARKRY